MTSTLDRGDRGPGWAQGRVGNVVFLDFRTDMPDESLEPSFEIITRTLARHPQGIVLIVIVGEPVRVPSTATRRSIAAFLQARSDRLLLGCTVIEGDSVAAIVKRAAVSLMMTLLKAPYPHRTMRTVAVGCDFAAPKARDDSGAALGQGMLVAAYAALRAPNVAIQPSS